MEPTELGLIRELSQVMAEVFAPYRSTQVRAAGAGSRKTTLGTTWQEIVTRVEGFRIKVSDHIHEVENLTYDKTHHSLVDFVATGAFRYWHLYPGEYSTRVDVACSETVILGLRIHTSKRVSPWFGRTNGSYTTIQPKKGYYINAFYGAHGPEGCTRLGAVCVPLEVADEGHRLTFRGVDGEMIYLRYDQRYNSQYRTYCATPRAVVVTLGEDDSINGVCVVTPVEYQRLCLFEGPLKQSSFEHWVVFADGELIETVSLTIVGAQIVGIRFRTNMQTASCSGRIWSSDTTTKSFNCVGYPDNYICGFNVHSYGSGTKDEMLVGIGVVYAEKALVDAKDVRVSSAA